MGAAAVLMCGEVWAAGVSEPKGITTQGITTQGISNQGISNQGISNQGISNQGISNQGCTLGYLISRFQRLDWGDRTPLTAVSGLFPKPQFSNAMLQD